MKTLKGQQIITVINGNSIGLMRVNDDRYNLLAVERVLLNYVEIHMYYTLYPDIASLGLQQAKVVAIAKNSAERRYAQSLRTLAALVRALPAKKRKKVGSVTPGLKVCATE